MACVVATVDSFTFAYDSCGPQKDIILLAARDVVAIVQTARLPLFAFVIGINNGMRCTGFWRLTFGRLESATMTAAVHRRTLFSSQPVK